MKKHDLKIWPEYFKHIQTGEKNFELRYDDRGYKAGDILNLKEWEQKEGYTGKEIEVKVTYILSGTGLQKGWVIMAIMEKE